MPYRVHYLDEATGYEWFASFESEQEALSQAASDVAYYGGATAQEVLGPSDVVVDDQEAIIAEADSLGL